MLLEVLDPKTAKSVMLLRVITRFYPGFTRETSISILETQFTRTQFLRVVPNRYSTRPDSIKVEEVYQSGELAHGCLLACLLADHPNVNGIALQQLSFISIGVCTMLLTAAPYFTVTTFVADLSVRDFWILALVAKLRCFIPVGIGSRKLVFWVKMKKYPSNLQMLDPFSFWK